MSTKSLCLRQGLALLAALALLTSPAQLFAAPAIQSLTVQPTTLLVGQPFTIFVTASADATQGTATVDFRPWATRVMRVVLAKQGSQWTGTGTVPADLLPAPGAKATVTAILLDAARASATSSIQVGVGLQGTTSIVAEFAGGILTVTGTPLNETLRVSRTSAGNLLVNDGTIPITGGVPTIVNTTLVRLLGLAGDDTLTIDETNGPLPAAQLVGDAGNDTLNGGSQADQLDGGPGDDILRGGAGDDLLIGGTGSDQLIGGRGSDVEIGGGDDDVFVWSPGDGSDVLEGQAGNDTLVFNGANISENYDLSANGNRLRLTRDVANITMDCGDVERVILNPIGGADNVTVNDLAGTSVTKVQVDLSASGSAGIGDSQSDRVTVNGTASADIVDLNTTAAGTTVTGLAATVVVTAGEADFDTLQVNGLAGDDVINANGVTSGAQLVLNGGAGNDLIVGGATDDILTGGPGSDAILAGAGDDIMTWAPGDGSDIFEGQAGHDTIVFSASNVSEIIDIAANGGRVRLTRNVANITLDCNDVEDIELSMLGGSDMVTVNDLTGTDLTRVGIDLATSAGLGDGSADSVIVHGTAGDDTIVVSGSPATGTTVVTDSGSVVITGSEAANDRLTIQADAGNDAVDASTLQAGVIGFTASGGDGDDILVGSSGDDILLGGAGDDILFGGAGTDILDGGSGSNILIP